MAELTEGESYVIRVTITNQSVRAGAPVEATLEVVVYGDGAIVYLFPSIVTSEYFPAGQTRTLEYPLNVPIGYGGQSGRVWAVVRDPAGVELARASEEITITSVGPPAKITAFEWSPDMESWEPVNGAIINQAYWYWRIIWVNNLDTPAEYWGIVRVGDEPHALGYTSAQPGETVTRLLSGFATSSGSYKATAMLTLVGDETEIIDQAAATYQVLI